MTEYDNTDPETFERSGPSSLGAGLAEASRAVGSVSESFGKVAGDTATVMAEAAKESARGVSRRAMERAALEAAKSGDPTPERVVIDDDSILGTPVEGEPLNRMWDNGFQTKVRVVTSVERLKREGAFAAYYNGEPTRVHVEIGSWPSGSGESFPVFPRSTVQNFEPYPARTVGDTRFVAFEFSSEHRGRSQP